MTRAHGLHGHVVVHPETDHPGRFSRRATVQAADGRTLTVATAGDRSPGILVRFAEVADRTAAEALVGTELWIAADDRRPLDDDEFWPDEVVGCSVATASGRPVGTVVDVIEGAAQHRLVVEHEGVTFEIPFVQELVPHVDPAAGRIVVSDISGLVPDA